VIVVDQEDPLRLVFGFFVGLFLVWHVTRQFGLGEPERARQPSATDPIKAPQLSEIGPLCKHCGGEIRASLGNAAALILSSCDVNSQPGGLRVRRGMMRTPATP
jgi:hypothetical protein